MDKPYFARIDFVFNDTKEKKTLYIGKNGVIKDGEIYITDWRAPISSLYYDSDLGKASFEVPVRDKREEKVDVINGELLLKRQFDIEKGELLDYFDVDLVSNDSLLQKYLNTNNDERLKSIVSTIQKEQNEVIRKSLYDNLIVQGVAGSGKTTVALHRIAYLVYNYLDKIKQSQYMVIGPNEVFLKYIQAVLPELDVSSVTQFTFEKFVSDYIKENINIYPASKKANSKIAYKSENDIDKFKCSLKYKDMLDLFLKVFYKNLVSKDLKIDDFTILKSKEIEVVFNEILNSRDSNLLNIIELTTMKLVKLIEERNGQLLSRYMDYSYEVFKCATSEDKKNKLRNKFEKARNEINKGCKSTIRKYFSKANTSSLKLYKLFINSIDDYNIYNYENINELKEETLSNLKNNTYEFEDLSAVMYLCLNIKPNEEYKNIKHTIIDEAQDFGEFNFYSMKRALSNSTFSIFGDIAQSIYDYRGIDDWNEVNKAMFDDKGQIIEFRKSYRTTAEIMNVADDISEYIGLGRSDLVVRHGNDVSIDKVDVDKVIDHIIKKIKEYKEKGYKTIAVISKTDLLSRYMNDDLMFEGLRVPNVSENDDVNDEKFNICTISNSLAKGLEFDAVIIPDASEKLYSSDNSLDMKLLYVAITRALHELDIIYSEDLTKPLTKKLVK